MIFFPQYSILQFLLQNFPMPSNFYVHRHNLCKSVRIKTTKACYQTALYHMLRPSTLIKDYSAFASLKCCHSMQTYLFFHAAAVFCLCFRSVSLGLFLIAVPILQVFLCRPRSIMNCLFPGRQQGPSIVSNYAGLKPGITFQMLLLITLTREHL